VPDRIRANFSAVPSSAATRFSSSKAPSAFGRDLQCQPVRGANTRREECYWSHVCKRFKRSKGVKHNGNVECTFRRKTGTVQQSQPGGANPNTAEPMVKNAHRTVNTYVSQAV
jgi:hypothetical protein